MATKDRRIAVSPIEECLCLAALSRKQWDALDIAGRNWIEQVLGRWLADAQPLRAIILVPQVQNPLIVRKLLQSISQKGANIRWYAPEASETVRESSRGIPGIDLITGPRMADAFFTDNALPPNGKGLLLDLENANRDLLDFVRYKTSLSFMQEMHPAPLLDAIATIARCPAYPFSLRHLSKADQRSLERFREDDFPYIEGFSGRLAELKRRILQIAPTDLSTLIIGETGTGKEYAAFYIHEYSLRRGEPYVALNCAGLDENLLRSELFGYKQGAFTGAVRDKTGLIKEADGGTLFLDEVGEMPLPIQADLLRFLQTKRFRPVGDTREVKVNVRIIAATQPDLPDKMKRREFRHDLYYRIADVVLHTPALREVPEDIPHIIRHLVYRQPRRDNHWQAHEEAIAYFEKHAEAVTQYAWPGNVRELLRAVRRRMQLAEDVAPHLGKELAGAAAHRAVPGPETDQEELQPADSNPIRPLQDIARDYVRQQNARRETLGLSQQQLAQHLGITVNTLKKYLK